jgi:hypothetical protein
MFMVTIFVVGRYLPARVLYDISESTKVPFPKCHYHQLYSNLLKSKRNPTIIKCKLVVAFISIYEQSVLEDNDIIKITFLI